MVNKLAVGYFCKVELLKRVHLITEFASLLKAISIVNTNFESLIIFPMVNFFIITKKKNYNLINFQIFSKKIKDCSGFLNSNYRERKPLFNREEYFGMLNCIDFNSNLLVINFFLKSASFVFFSRFLIKDNQTGAAVEVPLFCRGFFICKPAALPFHNNFFWRGRALGEENLLINDPTLPPELLVNNIRLQTGPFFFIFIVFIETGD